MNSREWLISHDVDSSKAMCDALDEALKEQREAVAELKQAIEFFDKVKASSEDERRAAGRDHWNWIESAARKLVEKE